MKTACIFGRGHGEKLKSRRNDFGCIRRRTRGFKRHLGAFLLVVALMHHIPGNVHGTELPRFGSWSFLVPRASAGGLALLNAGGALPHSAAMFSFWLSVLTCVSRLPSGFRLDQRRLPVDGWHPVGFANRRHVEMTLSVVDGEGVASTYIVD